MLIFLLKVSLSQQACIVEDWVVCVDSRTSTRCWWTASIASVIWTTTCITPTGSGTRAASASTSTLRTGVAAHPMCTSQTTSQNSQYVNKSDDLTKLTVCQQVRWPHKAHGMSTSQTTSQNSQYVNKSDDLTKLTVCHKSDDLTKLTVCAAFI